MSEPLADAVRGWLGAAVPDPVRALAQTLGRDAGADAVLFYGSNLRTGLLEGVLDFYVLLPGPAERGIWPTVSYHEIAHEGRVLRAKVATMRLATFRAASEGRRLDTTVWTRFAQPSALAWSQTAGAREAVVAAVAAAAITASRFAALLGPTEGTPSDFWRALFRATYATELRVERGGREEQLLAHGAAHLGPLLSVAWRAGQVDFGEDGGQLRPLIAPGERRRLARQWRLRRRVGRPLNIVRLVRAAFTFEGAARYATWKIERHTGVAIALTPWRERHPLLAAPGVLWRVWRAA